MATNTTEDGDGGLSAHERQQDCFASILDSSNGRGGNACTDTQESSSSSSVPLLPSDGSGTTDGSSNEDSEIYIDLQTKADFVETFGGADEGERESSESALKDFEQLQDQFSAIATWMWSDVFGTADIAPDHQLVTRSSPKESTLTIQAKINDLYPDFHELYGSTTYTKEQYGQVLYALQFLRCVAKKHFDAKYSDDGLAKWRTAYGHYFEKSLKTLEGRLALIGLQCVQFASVDFDSIRCSLQALCRLCQAASLLTLLSTL